MKNISLTSEQYHLRTSYSRGAISPHRLDWANQPDQFKVYPHGEPLPLPALEKETDNGLLETCRKPSTEKAHSGDRLARLSWALHLACALTAKIPHPGKDHYLRSSPSAGALYPNELYLATLRDDRLLPSGIYHYGMNHAGVVPLRSGDAAKALVEAFHPLLMQEVECILLVSAIFFKSAWKYRNRAYRYVLLDGGHLIENLFLALRTAGHDVEIRYNFDDATVNRLLGFESDSEVCLAGIGVMGDGPVPGKRHVHQQKAAEQVPAALSASVREVRYDDVLAIHRAGHNIVGQPSAPLQMHHHVGIAAEEWHDVKGVAEDLDSGLFGFAESAVRRRSRRNFVPEPIGKEQFQFLLNVLAESAALGQKGDIADAGAVCCGFLASRINGFKPGLYLFDILGRCTARVHEMDFTGRMATICLDQTWLKNAGVHFIFMTNLAMLDRHWGARGYRYAMMAAGRMGHAVYLGATALGLGCCGIGAFYDDEAKGLLGLNSESAMLYLVAAGRIRTTAK